MKALLALIAFALLLTAACSSGDAATTTCSNPDEPPGPSVSPLADLPEGTLLLARELPHSLLTLNNECGTTTALRSATQTWLAPDGSKAAALLGIGNSSKGLAVIDGEGVYTVAEWSSEWWVSAAWSVDGKRLAYNRPGSSTEGAGTFIWDGSESKRIYSGVSGTPIGWTSDGKVVLKPSINRLSVLNAAGDEVQAIKMPFDDFSEGSIVSPDGKKLAVMSEYAWKGEPRHSTGLWLYDFGSQEWTRLAEMNASVSSSPGAGLFVSANASLALRRKGTPAPTWSPDSQRLTYYRVYTDANQVYHADLWLYDSRSGEDKQLSDRSGYGGTWSKDGRYLAYRVMNPTGVGVLGPGGQVSEIPIGSGPEAWIAWSPDHRLIISTGAELELYDPRSGSTQKLLFEGASIAGSNIWESEVHASPSGRYFAFSATMAIGANGQIFHGKPGVYTADTQSGEVTRLLDEQGTRVSGWLGE